MRVRTRSKRRVNSASRLRTGGLSVLLALAVVYLMEVRRPEPRLTPLVTGAEAILDVAYADDHPQQRLDIYLPNDHEVDDEPIPVVIWIHGGGWVGGDKSDSLPIWEWTERDFAVVSINYRYATEPHHVSDSIDDASRAVQFIIDNASMWGLDPDRIGVYGFSAGGHLAAMVAHKELPVAAVVLAGAPTDFRPLLDPEINFFNGLSGPDVVRFSEDVLGCSGSACTEAARLASPAALSTGRAPILVVHGRLDGIVHVSQAEILATHLADAGADVELIIVDNEGHSSLLGYGPDQFLERHLAGS